MTGRGDQRMNAPFRHASRSRQSRLGFHAYLPVDDSCRALGDRQAGVLGRVVGPFRRRETQHATEDNQ